MMKYVRPRKEFVSWNRIECDLITWKTWLAWTAVMAKETHKHDKYDRQWWKWACSRMPSPLAWDVPALRVSQPISDTDDYGNIPVVEPFEIHPPSNQWLGDTYILCKYLVVSSYNKVMELKWAQDRRKSRKEIPEPEKEKVEQYTAPRKYPRHKAEERKMWSRKLNHGWAARFWKIRPADMRPANKTEIKVGTPEWKSIWGAMEFMEPLSPEWSKALTAWRNSQHRRGIDAADLKPTTHERFSTGAWSAYPKVGSYCKLRWSKTTVKSIRLPKVLW